MNKIDRSDLLDLAGMVLAGAQHYLQMTLGVACSGTDPVSGDAGALALNDTTAIVGLGGAVDMLVAVSFEEALLAHLLLMETAGLAIPDGEQEVYLRETAAEIANIILGNCLGELECAAQGGNGPDEPENGVNFGASARRISMSAPIVIQDIGRIHQQQGATLFSVALNTQFGRCAINIMGPRGLFGASLRGTSAKERN